MIIKYTISLIFLLFDLNLCEIIIIIIIFDEYRFLWFYYDWLLNQMIIKDTISLIF